MPRKFEVLIGGRATAARVIELNASEVKAILADWREEAYGRDTSRTLNTALFSWKWLDIFLNLTGFVLGLSVEGQEGIVGMLSLDINGRSGVGLPAIEIVYAVKRPSAFGPDPEPITGVARCLVIAAVAMSKAQNRQGRSRIRMALHEDPEDRRESPTRIYQSFGFELTFDGQQGVDYDDLELSAENADRLLEGDI